MASIPPEGSRPKAGLVLHQPVAVPPPRALKPQRRLARRSLRITRSRHRRRAGSAITSISTILPRAILKPEHTNSRPRGRRGVARPHARAPVVRTGNLPRRQAPLWPPPPRRAPQWARLQARPHGRLGARPRGQEPRSSALKSPPARQQEGVDNFSLAGEVGIGNRGRCLRSAARAACEPACRSRGTAHDGGDLVERRVEHVRQHERDPLGGSQRFEDHEQRETDRVGQQRLILRLDPSSGPEVSSGTWASRGSSRRDLRERSMSHPRDDRRGPSAEVRDAACAGVA
jgi:hypothetical protein